MRARYVDYPAFTTTSSLGTFTKPDVETQEICADAETVIVAAQMLEDEVDAANKNGIVSEFLDWSTFKNSLNNCDGVWKGVSTICDVCSALVKEVEAQTVSL